VGFKPGIELTMEAFDGYWRKPPSIKRIVLRSVPDESTRLAQLKTGEVDGIYWITGQLAEDLQRTPGLTLSVSHTASQWLYFAEQWDPKSPWHRFAGAAGRQFRARSSRTSTRRSSWGTRCCTTTPLSPRISSSTGRPRRRRSTRPKRSNCSRRRVTRTVSMPDRSIVMRPLRISARRWSTACARLAFGPICGPIERAGFYKSFSEKKLNGLVMGGSAAFGNAATRLEAFAVKGGAYAYGSYPDIDALFEKQAAELDHAKREALLFQMQQLVQEKVIAASIWQLAALSGVGPRVGESRWARWAAIRGPRLTRIVTLKSGLDCVPRKTLALCG
jgi:peptide/nickel transport system substrate-binding protein